MGSSASKAAHAATTNEPTKPEPKHLADLIQHINETKMSVEHLADVLSQKSGSSNWVVVFKALVTVHHLMVHGNERFIQHLASRNSLFTLHNFLDKSAIEGSSMSVFIRRYSRYLNEKSLAYRLIASDITKVKRGANGVMRTMNTKELLNTLPVIQTQFDALLNFNAHPEDITNSIIYSAFMLLFKDSLRLFAVYNEGIINLLDKYFDMRKHQCKESLDIYTKFIGRTTKLAQFLKVAEKVGIDQNDIPLLTQAPHSLIEALKQHLTSLEEKNDILPPYSMHLFHQSQIVQVYKLQQAEFGLQLFSLHDMLQITLPSQAHKSVGDVQQSETIIANNLDDSLVSLVGNLNFEESCINTPDTNWCQSSEMEISDGMNWQLNTYTCTSTLWNSISVPIIPHLELPPLDFPVTSQQMPMYTMITTPMESPSFTASQTTIDTQEELKTSSLSIQSLGHQMQSM